MDTKSVSDWLAITSQEGRTGWSKMYKNFLLRPVSNPDRFFQAVDNFGQVIMFESIISASTRNLEGDPLNYVIAVAVAKVNEQIESITAADRYALNLKKSKQRTALQNEEVEEKFRKALGEKNVRA